MKVYLAICFVWVLCLGVVVTGKSESIEYEIHFASDTKETYPIKSEVLKRYQDLVQGVHDESVISMVLHNLHYFEWEEDMQARWQNNRLLIVIGNGKGTIIEGDLEGSSLCFPEAKPKSFLAELFL